MSTSVASALMQPSSAAQFFPSQFSAGLRRRNPFSSPPEEGVHDSAAMLSAEEWRITQKGLTGPTAQVRSHLSWACKQTAPLLMQHLAATSAGLNQAGAQAALGLPCPPLKLYELEAAIMHCEAELGVDEREDDVEDVDTWCRNWLAGVQSWVQQVQRHASAAQQAITEQRPGAAQQWQHLMQSSATLLLACTISGSEGEAREPAAHPESLDSSSCASSVCGSSMSCQSSDVMKRTSTDKTGPRLVAPRARMQYTSHWAFKVAV
eukprot:CAMPEP_0119103940 /NCGR_PEP_ID=MMETSP1180-20130426/2274_1 /TAXON_ID=3052 ORGANISM="Chlamydomonas cf sp, Strain CCMP681" /NCGR_SAMPLE_ID=MMETSP1180 /ASSEMBLY_ACC=CAM_ASM_000741 /LENGTH=263 /DNA_ID=CAMNT_0007088565 /DNA_START=141 /DNA_END=932 /DNA_ORIENTATION=-